MKKKMRKFLLTLSAALLLVTMTVGVTVAYLTDSEEVTNTFSVGKVHIKLDEVESTYKPATNKYEKDYVLDADGNPTATEKRTEVGESYKLMPNIEIAKDPTVTVLEGSSDSYVRALVTVTYKAAADTLLNPNWLVGFEDETWVPSGLTTEKTYTTTTDEDGNEVQVVDTIARTYELRYCDTTKSEQQDVVLATTADLKLAPIFTGIKLPADLENDDVAALEGLEIKVVANAIQADGFADADAAWTAFNSQGNN